METATAIKDPRAATTKYHAGAKGVPRAEIKRVAMKGAVPPNNAFETLKLTAKPL